MLIPRYKVLSRGINVYSAQQSLNRGINFNSALQSAKTAELIFCPELELNKWSDMTS